MAGAFFFARRLDSRKRFNAAETHGRAGEADDIRETGRKGKVRKPSASP